MGTLCKNELDAGRRLDYSSRELRDLRKAICEVQSCNLPISGVQRWEDGT